MYLDRYEEEMLKGEFGAAPQMAMRVLAKLGDQFGAKRMLPVSSVHCVLRGNGPPGETLEMEYLERLVNMGAKVSVPVDQNPAFAGWTKEDYELIHTPSWIAEIQDKCSECMAKMNGTLCYTCTPYLVGNTPRLGEDVAWCESSAVIYANSIIGARTDRYTAYLDWLIAVAGRVPEMGRHITENRKADVIVKIDPKIEEWKDCDYAALGHFIGSSLGSDYTPVIENFPKNTQVGDFIQLGAGQATHGGISMYHIVGVTPEARTVEDALQGDKPRDTIIFDQAALKEHKDRLGASNSGMVNAVILGCPHYTLAQVMNLTRLLRGRKSRAEIYLFTTRTVYQQLEDAGLTEQLRRSGVLIFPGNCFSSGVSRARAMGIEGIMTNSGKAGRPSWMFGSVEECVEAAVKGER